MGATITIENAVKRYGNDTIINGLSLEVKPGEFFTLLGPRLRQNHAAENDHRLQLY